MNSHELISRQSKLIALCVHHLLSSGKPTEDDLEKIKAWYYRVDEAHEMYLRKLPESES